MSHEGVSLKRESGGFQSLAGHRYGIFLLNKFLNKSKDKREGEK